MEEHNAINQQGVSPELNEKNDKNYSSLVEENENLRKMAEKLYQRILLLENTWRLQRAAFLMDIVKSDKFDADVTAKASKELTDFLFPIVENEDKNLKEE